MKKGDKYIHYTKYGSVNIGIVAEIGVTHSVILKEGIIIEKPYFLSNNKVLYQLDGSDGQFFIIHKELTEKQMSFLKTFGIPMKIKENMIINDFDINKIL